ncbi:MAG: dihydroorotate dehydrogenase electron transfer subunit [Chloroflexi bacterium]|nr:dihydroorotate dehydrogenase electron transfer subunit [Chloroflexota bacterium]
MPETSANGAPLLATYLMWLDAPGMPAPAPGQFVMVRCGEICQHTLPRPLSIHQVDGTRLALLFQVTGKDTGTAWLARRQPGDEMDITGPLGNGYRISSQAHNLLLAAGGIGIAPIAFLASEATKGDYTIRLLYGARHKSHLYPAEWLPEHVALIPATDDGSAGKKGRVTDFLAEQAAWADQIFVCGPPNMYATLVSRKAELFKGKRCQLSVETRMGCGHGVCYSCTVKTRQGLRQVCKDGPVFDLDDILWDELGWFAFPPLRKGE